MEAEARPLSLSLSLPFADIRLLVSRARTSFCLYPVRLSDRCISRSGLRDCVGEPRVARDNRHVRVETSSHPRLIRVVTVKDRRRDQI